MERIVTNDIPVPLRRGALSLLLIALTLCLSGSATSDDAPPAWQQASEGIAWQAGIVALSIVPGHPQTLWLAAYEPGGLYWSRDGAATWQRHSEGLDDFTPLSILAVAEDTVYAGTYIGLYRLGEGGAWARIAGLPALPAYAVAASEDGGRIMVGYEEEGIYRSTDGGDAWERIPLHGAAVLSLAIDAGGTAYIGTAEQGLWRLEPGSDMAERWTPADKVRHVPAVRATPDGAIYMLGDARLWVRNPEEDGWQAVGPREARALSFALPPDGRDRLYVGARGIWISTDGGKVWDEDRGALRKSDVICLTADPHRPGTLYAGTQWYGLFKTVDNGKTWAPASVGVGSRPITALAGDPRDPRRLYAGAGDGVYRSDDGGGRWHRLTDDMGKLQVQALTIDPTRPDRLYAGTHDGIYVSEDRGTSWRHATADLGPVSVFGLWPARQAEARAIHAGSWGNNILRCEDSGATWRPLHNGLETLSVYAFATSPEDEDMWYVGTVEALYRSEDRGASWRRVDGLPPSISTFSLATDPHSPRTLYAGTTEGVYRSLDGGDNWSLQRQGMPALTANVVAVDPDDSRTIYCGTEHGGVYRSRNGADTWEAIGPGTLSVYDIYLDTASGVLWAGTEDGVWKLLDD